MSRTIVFVVLVFVIFGCSQNTSEKTFISESLNKKEETISEKYADYLLLMTDKQRANFFKLSTTNERKGFLLEHGIEQQKYLNDNLKKGMTTEKVLDLLGTPEFKEQSITIKGKQTKWIYSQFNGYRNIKYVVILLQGRVTFWKVIYNQ